MANRKLRKSLPGGRLRPASVPAIIGSARCEAPSFNQFDRVWQKGTGGPKLETVDPPLARADRVVTFDEAKAKFQKCWDAWKAWAERLNFFRDH